MSDSYQFDENGVKRIVDAVRKVEKLGPSATQPNGTIAAWTSFDQIIVCILTEELTRTGQANAKKVWRESYVSDWEPITEDEFKVVAPTLEGTYPVDTICYAFWYRPCGEWIVFHADGCPEPA